MKRTKRLLCLVLVFVFVAALLPAAAYADPPGEACRSPLAQENNGRHYWIIDHVDQPGCTEGGTQHWVCQYCGKTYAEALPALGHNWTEEEPAPGFAPATCTEGTTMIRTCGDCGAQETFEQPPLGHDWETVTTEPHGLVDGSVVSTCRRCGETKTEVLSAATSIFNLVRHVPDGAEDADALVIVTQPEGGLISYGGGDSLTLTVAVSGGVPDYHYEWHKVSELENLEGSVIGSAAADRFKGALERYKSESSSFASAFQSAAKGLGLGQSLKQNEASEQPAYIPLGDAIIGSDSPGCAVTSAGRYYCVVTDEAGNKVTSEEAAVNYHLYISQKPLSRNIRGLDSVTLSCVAVGCGEGNVLYSLRGPDGNFIATGLQTGAYDVSEPGEYQFSVDDLVSGESLDSVVVTVYDADLIVIGNLQSEVTREEEDAPEDIGMTVSGGVPPYSCVWSLDGKTLNSAVLDEPGSVTFSVDRLGVYVLTVTDAINQQSAESVTVKYSGLLKIKQQPEDGVLSDSNPIHELSIEMSCGEEPFTYTLYRNGNVDEVAIDSYRYSIFLNEPGEYYIHIEDAMGREADSDVVTVAEVYKPLSIRRQPKGGELTKRYPAHELSIVIANGEEPFTYELFYNGVFLEQYSKTVHSREYHCFVFDRGRYYFRVKDAKGHIVDSDTIKVTESGVHVNIDQNIFFLEQPVDVLLDPSDQINGIYHTVLSCKAVSADNISDDEDSALRYDWEMWLAGQWVYLYTGRKLPLETTAGTLLRCKVTDTRTGLKVYCDNATVNVKMSYLDGMSEEIKNGVKEYGRDHFYMHCIESWKTYTFRFAGGSAPYTVKIYEYDVDGLFYIDERETSNIDNITVALPGKYKNNYGHITEPRYVAVVTDAFGQEVTSKDL